MKTSPRRRSRRSVALLATLTTALPLAGVVGGVAASPSYADSVGSDPIAWLEVEDGAAINPVRFPAVGDTVHSNFSGTGFDTIRDAGEAATMTFEAPEAGTYPVYVRYASGLLGGQPDVRTIGLVANGTRQVMNLQLTTTASTPESTHGHWETWGWWTGNSAAQATVALNKGTNTIAVACASGDACHVNIDAIQIGGSAPDVCATAPADTGYRALFDGTLASYDQWRRQVPEGNGAFGRVVVGSAAAPTDCYLTNYYNGGAGAEWLMDRVSGSYVLRADWQWFDEAGESTAIYVGSTGRDNTPAGGYQFPLGRGSEINATTRAGDTGKIVTTGGATKDADTAAVRAALKTTEGAWNSTLIQVTPTAIREYLNGTLVNTLAGTIATDGYIGLKNSSSVSAKFKNIELLPTAQASSVTTVSPSSTKPVRGKDSVTVTATVDGGGTPVSGDVAFSVGGSVVATVPVVNGAASAQVGPFGSLGAQSITATYVGSELVTTSTGSATVTVVPPAPAPPVPPKVGQPGNPAPVAGAVVPSKIKSSAKKLSISFSARGAAGTVVKGAVKVYDGKKLIAKGTVVNGKVTVKLAKKLKKGKHKIKIVLSASATSKAATITKTVKVA